MYELRINANASSLSEVIEILKNTPGIHSLNWGGMNSIVTAVIERDSEDDIRAIGEDIKNRCDIIFFTTQSIVIVVLGK